MIEEDKVLLEEVEAIQKAFMNRGGYLEIVSIELEEQIDDLFNRIKERLKR